MKITWFNGPYFAASNENKTYSFELRFCASPDTAGGTGDTFCIVDSMGNKVTDCVNEGGIFSCRFSCIPESTGDSEIQYGLFCAADQLNLPERLIERILVRFSSCRFDEAGIRISPEERSLFAAGVTALRYYACKKYDAIAFVKKYTDGFSGALTLAFVPRTSSEPRNAPETKDTPSFFEPIRSRWAKPRLVKISSVAVTSREYEASRRYVRETLNGLSIHPDRHLVISGNADQTNTGSEDDRYGALVSNYMGPHSPLDFRRMDIFLRSQPTSEAVSLFVDGVFDGLRGWHDTFVVQGIEGYKTLTDKLGPFLSDVSTNAEQEPREILVDFRNHWKKNKKSQTHPLTELLERTKSVETRWSVIHGDLQPRNVFIDENGTPWFLDFEHTGEGPTLFDYVTFELHVRTSLLTYSAVSPDLAERTVVFERKLMESLWSMNMDVTSVIESIRPVTSNTSSELKTVVDTIVGIRRSAAPYSVGGPLRIDYLSLLYLTSLKWLRRISGKKIESVRHIISLTYVLEDVLLRHFNLTEQGELTAAQLIEDRFNTTPFGFNFLAGNATPRVRYFFEQPYAERYFPEITRLRGIVQPLVHHLDVFDHTFMVLENLERVFSTDFPSWIEKSDDVRSSDPILHRVTAFAAGETGNTLLKWVALFHDVGKYEAWDYNQGRIQHLGHERTSRIITADFFRRNPVEDTIASEVFRSLFGSDTGDVPPGFVEELVLMIIAKHHYYHDCFEVPDRPVSGKPTGKGSGKQSRVERAYSNLVPDEVYAPAVWDFVRKNGPFADLTVRMLLLLTVDLIGMADIEATGGFPRGKCRTDIDHVLADVIPFSLHFWQEQWKPRNNAGFTEYLREHVPMEGINSEEEKKARAGRRKELEQRIADYCRQCPDESSLPIGELVERSRVRFGETS